MIDKHNRMVDVNRYYIAVALLLVSGLVLSCARSYSNSGRSSDGEPGDDSAATKQDATVEAGRGSDGASGKAGSTGQAGAGGPRASDPDSGQGLTGGTGLLAAGTGGEDSASKDPVAPATDDEWDDLSPQGKIEAEGEAQLPIGLWIGETREAVTCSQSSRVTLEIAPGAEAGSAFGFAVFGEGDPPAPAKDPDVGYPPEDDRDALLCRERFPTEGFNYTILEGTINEDGRFQFRIAVVEIYEPWCALQTAYPSGRGGSATGYACMPNLSMEEDSVCNSLDGGESYPPPPENVECPVDYRKFLLCGEWGPCICTQDECAANMNRTFRFDLAVNGTEMEGLVTDLSLGDVLPIEVRLQKVR
jgi:hypothetical protein